MNFYILLFKLKTVAKSRTRFSLWGRCGTCVDSTKNKHIARNVNLGHVKDLLVGEENLSDGKGGYALKVESQSWQVVVHCAGDGILSSAEFRAAPAFRDWGYTATGWSRYSLLSVWYRQVSVNGRHKVSHKIGGEGHCSACSVVSWQNIPPHWWLGYGIVMAKLLLTQWTWSFWPLLKGFAVRVFPGMVKVNDSDLYLEKCSLIGGYEMHLDLPWRKGTAD